MRKARWLGGLGIVLLAGAVAAALIDRHEKSKKNAKPDAVLEFAAREVVRPTLASMPLQLEFSGPLVAPSTVVVRAKAAGTLLSLAVAEGARVRAGQSLGTLDLADLGSRLAERQATVASARAQFVQAERAHAANQRLAEQKFISPNALDTSKATLDAAKAQPRRDAGVAEHDACRPARCRARRADRRPGGQAPCGAGREARRRTAGSHDRRPVDARTRRQRRHPRGRIARAGHAGGSAHRRGGPAGDWSAGAHRPGRRGGHALDRRDDRARQRRRKSSAPGNTRSRGSNSPTLFSDSRCPWVRSAAHRARNTSG